MSERDVYRNSFNWIARAMKKQVACCGSLEEFSQEFVKVIYENLSGVVLARTFVTVQFDRSEPEQQEFMLRLLQKWEHDDIDTGDLVCLNLMGTYGLEPEWNDRHNSRHHSGVPILDSSDYRMAPMILRFLKKIGVHCISRKGQAAEGERQVSSGLFFVDRPWGELDEKGKLMITDQSFVQKYNIQAVAGFGSNYFLTRDEFFIVIVFFDEKWILNYKDEVTCISNLFKQLTREYVVQGNIFTKDIGMNCYNRRIHRQELAAAYQQLDDLQTRTMAINEKLAKASRVKSDFIATMSHELQTPLTAIMAYSEVLLSRTLPENQQIEYLYDIYNSAHHLVDLIQDLLNMNKVKSGRLKYHPSCFEFSELMEVAATIFNPMLKSKGISFRVEIMEDMPAMIADKNKLKQVMFNLLSNAIKFTEPGGEIRVKAEFYAGTQEVWVAVQDNGIGMSAEECRRIFEKYFNMDVDMTEAVGGVGLGLAICKYIMVLHGGDIWVDSELGKGSTFWLKLPIFLPDCKRKEIEREFSAREMM